MKDETAIKERLGPLLQDETALQFCVDIYNLAQLWDDIHDSDVHSAKINDAMYEALIKLPDNQFYAAYGNYLRPIILSAQYQWEAANSFERGGKNLDKAYMLRASLYQVFMMCVHLCRGREFAKGVSTDVFGLYGEDLEGYKKEIKLCQLQS